MDEIKNEMDYIKIKPIIQINFNTHDIEIYNKNEQDIIRIAVSMMLDNEEGLKKYLIEMKIVKNMFEERIDIKLILNIRLSLEEINNLEKNNKSN